MGGLSGFYYNSAGDFAKDAVWALEKIGASNVADVLQRANALFPNAQPSQDRIKRYNELKQLADSPMDSLRILTREFYAASYDECLDRLIEQFIDSHSLELPAPES
jgi:hypothetical protein